MPRRKKVLDETFQPSIWTARTGLSKTAKYIISKESQSTINTSFPSTTAPAPAISKKARDKSKRSIMEEISIPEKERPQPVPETALSNGWTAEDIILLKDLGDMALKWETVAMEIPAHSADDCRDQYLRLHSYVLASWPDIDTFLVENGEDMVHGNEGIGGDGDIRDEDDEGDGKDDGDDISTAAVVGTGQVSPVVDEVSVSLNDISQSLYQMSPAINLLPSAFSRFNPAFALPSNPNIPILPNNHSLSFIQPSPLTTPQYQFTTITHPLLPPCQPSLLTKVYHPHHNTIFSSNTTATTTNPSSSTSSQPLSTQRVLPPTDAPSFAASVKLPPGISLPGGKSQWTREEDDLLRELAMGGRNTWKEIAARLKGRSVDACHLRWLRKLKSETRGGLDGDDGDIDSGFGVSCGDRITDTGTGTGTGTDIDTGTVTGTGIDTDTGNGTGTNTNTNILPCVNELTTTSDTENLSTTTLDAENLTTPTIHTGNDNLPASSTTAEDLPTTEAEASTTTTTTREGKRSRGGASYPLRWTAQDDALLLRLGNDFQSWRELAESFPQRTPEACRVRYYTLSSMVFGRKNCRG